MPYANILKKHLVKDDISMSNFPQTIPQPKLALMPLRWAILNPHPGGDDSLLAAIKVLSPGIYS